MVVVILLVGFQAGRQRQHPAVGSLQGGANRARGGYIRSNVFTEIDARNAKCRLPGDQFHQRIEHRLRGRAIDGVGRHLLPIDLVENLVDGAIARGWQAPART